MSAESERVVRVALYPGDGIGAEVSRSGRLVADAAVGATGEVRLEWEELPWGTAWWREYGSAVPDDFLLRLATFDAIYLGALGWPAQIPDHVSLAPLVRIRQAFDQYACLRPARLYAGVASPLAGVGGANGRIIDLLVLRENSEGEYLDAGGRLKARTDDEIAVQTAVHTRSGVERIIRFGFELARTRRNHLTLVTKSNAMAYGMVLWDEELERLSGEYPDVRTDKQHVDAAAMNFVRQPELFDVVVASNLFGDILSDLGGVITGGLGLAPSANLNPERRFPSMFEPVHGSAPDIAGRGIANPVAAIVSAAMLLDWVGAPQAAERVRKAVAATLAAGESTPDLGGTLTTDRAAQAVVGRVGAD